jgi:hypothetical protein
VFVEQVDVVTGVGWDRALAAGQVATRTFDLRRVITNLCVLDFGGPDHRMRLVSLHPGVSVEEVTAATGFELAQVDEIGSSREPSDEDLRLIREVIDPGGLREREVPDPR